MLKTNLDNPFLSIAIPVWGIHGKGIDYLETNLSWLANQSFTDFEVIISDHSVDDFIKNYIELWSNILNIKYFKHEIGRGSISHNLNNALKHCSGDYIKILFQDDFLYNELSLETIVSYIKNKDVNWLVTGCAHTKDMETIFNPMIPVYHNKIYEGINTISSPSVLTIKNSTDMLYFNESLKWLMDVEYYKRCYDKYGLPDIVNNICVINRESDIRATTLISDEIKNSEVELLKNTFSSKIKLPTVTLIAVTSVRIEDHLRALKYSCKDIEFGAVKLISHIKPNNLPIGITHEYIHQLNNIDDWNYAMVYDLGKYVQTEHAILIHDDGFIINPLEWKPEFLEYDYIGAPWPIPNDEYSYRDITGELIRVGNSVSIRSKKLMDLPSKLGLEWKPFHGFYSEDGFICVNYRHEFIKHGCKFANIEVAKYFSKETEIPENQNIQTFAFHGKYSTYRKLIENYE